jgi:hypothetical protein
MFAVGFKALPFYAGAAKMSNITPGARADPTKARTLSSLFSAKVRKIRMNPFKIKGSRTEGSRERIKKDQGITTFFSVKQAFRILYPLPFI